MSITKAQLLEKFSEIDILKFYVEDFDPNSTKNYRSPFSEKDNKPSLSIYQTNTGWKFKSHNTVHQGDVFQFVADLKGINCKTNFSKIVGEIALDLGFNSFPDKKIKISKINITAMNNLKKTNKLIINEDKTALHSYFNPLGITSEILELYKVQAIKYHEFITKDGKLLKFDYHNLKQLAVLYTINNRIKVYFPAIDGIQDKKFGFKDQTTLDIFGLEQVTQPCDQLFIAAGEKDCLMLVSKGFQAISLQSENTNPTQEQIDKISSLSKDIYIVYDSDNAGENASNKLSKSTGWKEIILDKKYNDITDFFTKSGNYKVEFEKLINTKSDGVQTVFHLTENYLNEKYNIRFNAISLEFELKPKQAKNWSILNENDLYVELNKANIKIGFDKLIAILKSNFVPKYNPIIHYFENIEPWDGIDYISQLSNHLIAIKNQEQLNLSFKKWLVRALHCSIVPDYFNKHAFIIVHEKQNSGKTSFCRFLCPKPLEKYYKENLSKEKDGKIEIAKNFIINLDELESLSKVDVNGLKSIFSMAIVNERLPYEKRNSIIPRISSFIGSTNMSEFLTDETGSVRWLCFEIKDINWSYRESIDINKVWSQVYHLYQTGYDAEMSKDDIRENEIRNAKFQLKSAESELLPSFFKAAQPNDSNSEFLTATGIVQHISAHTVLKLNIVNMGKAMKGYGFEKVKDSKIDRFGYWCIKLK